MIVCRLCLTASNDVIHIFREVGVQLKVSSILSKHFGSLFEVTEEHDEAICNNCWSHTESFHAFYQSIKNAQNCYSSEDGSDDGLCQVDDESGLQQQQQQQQQQQNVKIIMYDSVTNEVIEQRHDGSLEPLQHQHQLQHQQHQMQQHHYQQHGVLVDGSSSSATGYDTYEVCEQTNDSSELDLLMMINPNDTGEVAATDDNGHQQQHHHQHQHQQQQQQQHLHHQHMVNEHDGLTLVDDEVEDDLDEQPDDEHMQHHEHQQQHNQHQQQHGAGVGGMDPLMGSVVHRTDSSSVMSDFLQNNEHITVIEVSSPSQAQKLLQQQQQQQLQLQQLQLQQQQRPPQPSSNIHQHSSPSQTRLVQRPANAIGGISTIQSASTVLNHAPAAAAASAATTTTTTNNAVVVQSVQVSAAPVRKRKMPTGGTIAVLNAPPAVGSIVQRAAVSTRVGNSNQQQQRQQLQPPQQRYIDLSEPESPPDTSNTSGSSAMLSPTGGATGEQYRMQCDLCNKTFKTFHRVQTHYQQKHNMNGYVICCGDQFFEKDLLVDHILMHVNNRRQMKKITCVHCEQFFYRKRFYTRHLLKVHNIGTAGTSSDPDSPPASNSGANTVATAAPTPSSSSSSAMPSNSIAPISSASTNVASMATATLPPPAAGQRSSQVIRRIVYSVQSNTAVTSQPVTAVGGGGSVIASTIKMPLITNIQSIVPKSRSFGVASSAAATQVTQVMRTTPTAAVSANNGASVESLDSEVEIKFEISDPKDEMLILGA